MGFDRDRDAIGGDYIDLPHTDLSQRQTGAILLLLQRLSERLAGLETLQRQQAERIDNINYR